MPGHQPCNVRLVRCVDVMRNDPCAIAGIGDRLGLFQVKIGDRHAFDARGIVYKIKNGAVSHSSGAEH